MDLVETSFALGEQAIEISQVELSHPEWDCRAAFSRTGIAKFHYSKSDNPVDLAISAFDKLQAIHKKDIDAVVFITQSYNKMFPGPAIEFLQRARLSTNALHVDFSIGCSGFPMGLLISESLLKSGRSRKVCLVTADVYSHYLKPDDRATRLLFSDGASCTILNADNVWHVKASHTNCIYEKDSSLELTRNENGISQVYMHGPSVYQFACTSFNNIIENCYIGEEDLQSTELFFIHQGSKTIVDELIARHSLPTERTPTLFPNIGNITSSSLPALLSLNFENLTRSTDILLAGFGVGLSVCGVRLCKT
jgi:3-oxoacyl-[acyl-carrier-protein] synthase-3